MMNKFKHLLQKEKIYTIKNLKIKNVNDLYRPIKGTMKANFLLTTVVKEIKDSILNISQHYLQFTSLEIL